MSVAAVVEGAPVGFARTAMAGFVGENGGFLRSDADDAVCFGFTVEARHCNPAGLCHGGWFATMADLQLVHECARDAGLTPAQAQIVTVSLSLDYLAAARLGEWVESCARVSRRTRNLIFAEGRIVSGDRPLMRMSGIFQARQG